MRKYFILVVVVFVLVAGLLAQANIEKVLEAFPAGKITDRHAFFAGAVFAQQQIREMRYKEALGAPRDEKEILAGLEGVEISVEKVSPEAEKYGLTQQLLQTDTELRLRQHGIRVFTDEEGRQNFIRGYVEQGKKRSETLPLKLRPLMESLAEKDSDEHFLQSLREVIQYCEQQATSPALPPCLYVNVNTTVSEESRRAAFSVRVELREMAYLSRNGAFCSAQVWHRSDVGTCSSSDLKEYVRECLRDFVDQFINAYLAANPKDRSAEETQ